MTSSEKSKATPQVCPWMREAMVTIITEMTSNSDLTLSSTSENVVVPGVHEEKCHCIRGDCAKWEQATKAERTAQEPSFGRCTRK